MSDLLARGMIKKVEEKTEEIFEQLAEIKTKVFVEQFKRFKNETDDTGRIQRACNSAAEFSTIEFDTNITYSLSSIVNEKSLNLNLNGAKFIIDPTVNLDSNNNRVKGNPAFYFKGSVSSTYNISSMTTSSSVINLLDSADTGYFSSGDYIIIEDATPIPKWDGGTGTTGYSEINIIKSILDNSLILVKPTEWAYKTKPTIKKINLLRKPQIYGASNITEVDPGAPYYDGLTGYAPHPIHFRYCLSPVVKDCHFDQWQLHAVNFHYCMFPLLECSTGNNPFRPDGSGSGYFMRFENCIGGTVRKCYAKQVRHLVDFVMSYDCLSENNTSVDGLYSAFYWHGNSSKRCKSINDTVLGGTSGWTVGNASFSADYDVTIMNATYKGNGTPLSIVTKSKNIEIENPDFSTFGRDGILISSGASDVKVKGGVIEILGTADNSRRAIMVRPQFVYSDTIGAKTGKVIFDGTKLRGVGNIHLRDDFSFTFINPDIELDNLTIDIFSQQTYSSGGIPIDFVVKGGEIRGNYNQAFSITNLPNRKYEITGISVEGFIQRGTNLIGGQILRFENNDFINSKGANIVYNIYGTNASLGQYSGNRPATVFES